MGGDAPFDLAIILPTLNERDNITPLIDRIAATLGDIRWEAIVVDDNSPDGTAQVVRDMARGDGRIRVIERIGRRGLASAVIEGICAASATHVAVMDADHQHDPAAIAPMLSAIKGGQCDVAIGSRFVAGADISDWQDHDRQHLSGIANRTARWLTGADLTDPMSGFFLMRTDRARALVPQLSGIGFKILLDLLAAARGSLVIAEFPITFGARRCGTSKLDSGVIFDFLAGVYDRLFGRIIPTRFALFGTVGALGVLVHMIVLAVLLFVAKFDFPLAQSLAVVCAMSFNFWLNNGLTYRDQRLRAARAVVAGWAVFCLTCALGGIANVAVASLLNGRGVVWFVSAIAGIVTGSVWNYALSSRFVWGRF